MFNQSSRKGFTLIEMLIVIVIIGVLAAALIPRVTGIQARARDTARTADLRNVSTAIEVYALDNGSYPIANFVVLNTSPSPLTSTNFFFSQAFAQEATSSLDTISEQIGSYLKTIPSDPNGNGIATNSVGNCVLKGKSYSYYTAPGLYAITSLKESKKGNASACSSVIDRDNDGAYEKAGKGLKTLLSQSSSGSYPPSDQWTDKSCFNFSAGILVNYNNTCTKNVIIPGTTNNDVPITSIARDAFKSRNIISITIPPTVKSIEYAGFYGNLLTSIVIPDGVISIGEYAFDRNQLTSVVIPNSVTVIRLQAFYSNQLTSVTLSTSLTSIGQYAFRKNLLTSLTIPSSVLVIGNASFYDNKLESLNLLNGVTSIQDYAFGANQLTSLTIPNSVTSIGIEAFDDNKLTSITIPSSVTSLGADAFSNNGPNKNSANITDFVPGTNQTRNLVGSAWVKQ